VVDGREMTCDIVWSPLTILSMVTKQCQPVGISPPQSSGVRWSLVESSGFLRTVRPVESTGLPTRLESSWSPPDWQSGNLAGPISDLAGNQVQLESTRVHWSPLESTGLQPEYVGERKGLQKSVSLNMCLNVPFSILVIYLFNISYLF